MPNALLIGLLGPLQVRDETGRPVHIGGRQLRVLLTLLALNAGRVGPLAGRADRRHRRAHSGLRPVRSARGSRKREERAKLAATLLGAAHTVRGCFDEGSLDAPAPRESVRTLLGPERHGDYRPAVVSGAGSTSACTPWPAPVVIDLDVRRDQARGGGQRFPGAGIAGEARMRAAADLQPESVPGCELVGGGAHRNRDGFLRQGARGGGECRR